MNRNEFSANPLTIRDSYRMQLADQQQQLIQAVRQQSPFMVDGLALNLLPDDLDVSSG
jgi:hypothetical protein